MIRVAFPNPSRTPGKYNYYRSVLMAIKAVPSGRIEPVILTGAEQPPPGDDFPRVRIITSRLLDQGSKLFRLRQRIAKFHGFDLALEGLCRAHGIKALSHFGFLRPRSQVKTLPWIYDFQHKHLPGYFSEEELAFRDKSFADNCRHADRVIVSSHDAANDLVHFYPEGAPKVRVLQFVGAPSVGPATSLKALKQAYGIPEKFFALPNQFWVHKNHQVVLEALRQLRDQRETVCVVATGPSNDPRAPDYYNQFVADIEAAGLAKHLLILGVVPYDHVLALIRHSVAVINPSLFEGWSTSVEEGKSLGKRVLLSSLAVHREQAPERATFFDPKDSVALARAMVAAWTEYDPSEEEHSTSRAQEKIQARLVECGRRYEDIVAELLK